MKDTAMISCRQLISFLAEYMDGGLTGEERATLERHLARCSSCRAYLASYRQTIMLSREALEEAVDDDVPMELVEAILSRER